MTLRSAFKTFFKGIFTVLAVAVTAVVTAGVFACDKDGDRMAGSFNPDDIPGRKLFVSKTGSDSNNGLTLTTSLLTITKAAQLSKPGDTVIVLPGVYAEQVIIDVDGTPDDWITFMAYPDNTAKEVSKNYGFEAKEQRGVVITGAEWVGSGVDVRASYIRVKGFFITSQPAGGDQRYDCAVALRDSSNANYGGKPKYHPYHHIEICDNVVYDGGQAGIAGGGNDYIYIRNNIVFRNSSAGVWMGSGISIGFVSNPLEPYNNSNDREFHYIVEGNICYSNSNYDIGRRKANGESGLPWDISGSSDGNGIIIDWAGNLSAGRSLVRNNIVYNNGQRGICLTYSSNAVVVNNTFYDNAWDPYYAPGWGKQGEFGDSGGSANDSSYPFTGKCGNDRNIFVNNIIYSATRGCYFGDAKMQNNTVYTDYNFYYNSGFGNGPSFDSDKSKYMNAKDKEGDPMFVNAPPLIAENGRLSRPGTINPVDPIHWYALNFALKPGSPAISAGYNTGSAFNKPSGMTDAMRDELKFYLDKALPEYDIFGCRRDPFKMEPGAIAYNKLTF